MDILPLIKENYPFEVKSKLSEGILETTQGRKKYRVWEDEKLLSWHQEWRDKCSKTPYQLTDRMLQTKDEKKAIKLENGWLTLHDELLDPYPTKDFEQDWAQFIARMIEFGDRKKEHSLSTNKREFPQATDWKVWVSTTSLLDEKKRKILQSCIQEAMRRKHKSLELTKKSNNQRLPLMDKISSTNQAKKVFDLFVWQGTAEAPESGFISLTNFFQQWVGENGEESLLKLLNEIDEQNQFREKYGNDLLAEAWLPWELANAMELFLQCEEEEEIETHFSTFEKEWNERRQLVLALLNWLKEDRKKVAT
ncbi:hypothetical protein [Alkalihalobacterium elongatum]|uniref:hypothetical protein n=1 Tax=Alkalihalobacterium elongatum TaxID=2675466 RepID=UPI001C1F568D|nr:hypothetical protein [Alkalihalobacterium elongatum]